VAWVSYFEFIAGKLPPQDAQVCGDKRDKIAVKL